MEFVFVDFGDHLYLHKEHFGRDDLDYSIHLIVNNKVYKNGLLNIRLLEKLTELKGKKGESNVGIIMIVHPRILKESEKNKSALFDNGKHIFDDYVLVSNSDDKVEYITKYVEYAEHVIEASDSKVIVIDNNISTLIQARKHLYKAFTPLEFCNRYKIK